jgi:hypothetical protein
LPIKIGVGDEHRTLLYGNLWKEIPFPKYKAILIAADANQIDLIKDLARILKPPFYILYVLLVPRTDNEDGRYESKPFYGYDELDVFLNTYSEYFENDGRHNIWICEINGVGRIIYDHHNLIYGYGNIEPFKEVLKGNGNTAGEFSINHPHRHYFNEEYDEDEKEILSNNEWKRFPLQENDNVPPQPK